jgi:hypothetical protein
VVTWREQSKPLILDIRVLSHRNGEMLLRTPGKLQTRCQLCILLTLAVAIVSILHKKSCSLDLTTRPVTRGDDDLGD